MRLLWRSTSDSANRQMPAGVLPTQPALFEVASGSPNDRAALVDAMISSHRSALLLRPKLAQDLELIASRTAIACFRQDTCLVSAGRVRLNRWQVDAEADSDTIDSTDCVHVDELFLERCTITNEKFQAFVEQGGYQKKSLWHASVWPCVKEFVDRSGSLGPRFWSNGRPGPTTADHPVVGISWFEAEAYSRWIGMRLPTDAEWVRAACSPIEAEGTILQRKYPWGDSFSSERANLWSSSAGRTVPSNSYAEGDSVGGARQMVGNVWEWTSSNLQLWNGEDVVELVEPMKSLRGGAFDSYLDNRATCQCRSADSPLARRHNIGFRCAVSACDVVEVPGHVDGRSTPWDTSEETR
ncbi:MAG: SUMF1/EgtB/PvdO family nonheme iron enzyme [Planctomycetota bacterium]|nr:SUMF1/EgtB/PvdO family nonheme iron enzyme [Planctomycetota bacterium]